MIKLSGMEVKNVCLHFHSHSELKIETLLKGAQQYKSTARSGDGKCHNKTYKLITLCSKCTSSFCVRLFAFTMRFHYAPVLCNMFKSFSLEMKRNETKLERDFFICGRKDQFILLYSTFLIQYQAIKWNNSRRKTCFASSFMSLWFQ